jgi:hypothetical protein
MPNPLFSKYSQGENRVTASILAVFERISFALLERILQILCEEPNQSLLEVKNQIKPKGFNAVPDGAIQASFAYWLETKVFPNAVSQEQIKRHLEALESYPHAAKKKLIVLTPDSQQPTPVSELKSPLVVWTNFTALTDAIGEVLSLNETWLTGDLPLASEQERFLLRELVQMFLAEGLLNTPRSDLALIVPARSAIHDYEQFSVYLCQPNRSFQKVEYLGFYRSGAIDHRIAKILIDPIEEVELTAEGIIALAKNEPTKLTEDIKQKLTKLVEALQLANSSRYRDTMKVFFLSGADHPETIRLTQDIQNDLKSAAGRPTAFTQSQRYVPLISLKKNPTTTSELLNSS